MKLIWLGILSLAILLDLLFLSASSSNLFLVIVTLAQLMTGGLGTYLLKQKDINTILYVDIELRKGEKIVDELLDETVLMIGCILLIIPGFLTDIFGAILVYEKFRKYILKDLFS